jgi:endonuclease YncB( thermonuclease family)
MIPFLCLVIAAPDADTLKCADGTRVSIAGITALERNCSCNSYPHCATIKHDQAQPIVSRMVLGKNLRCRRVGVSYDRIVATCTLPNGADLGCSIVRSGAAVEWPKYQVRYRLRSCAR